MFYKGSKGEIDYPGVGIITDLEVAKLVRKHTHWWDRLNYHKMTDAGLCAQLMLMKVYDQPKKKKWFFNRKLYEELSES